MNKMEKETLVQLTCELYRLTLLFPQKEPLRYKIRGLADDILASFLRQPSSERRGVVLEMAHDLEVLNSFLAVAQAQNWVSPAKLLNVSQGYDSLKKELEDIGSVVTDGIPETTAQNGLDFNGLKGNIQRHDRILEILKERGRAQVWEFKKIFPGVSKRTLRRDFEYLLSQGLVERLGEKNETFYQLVGQTETILA